MKLVSIDKLTDCKFLNLYRLNLINKKGNKKEYFVASRREKKDLVALNQSHNKSDAVMIIPVTENNELIILKQYRPAINDYIYEFPAGLVDSGEGIMEAAKRELFEETGLDIVDLELLLKPSYTSVGMSDESVAVVKANVKGKVNLENLEEDEEIEVIRVKLSEAKNFVQRNNVSIKTALAIMTI